jgi:glutamate dehydrogenase/leucine dehydrogenase
MSEIVIFAIGVVVFAITVWGTVVAGGVALSRVEVEQNQRRTREVDEEELDKRFPTRLKY